MNIVLGVPFLESSRAFLDLAWTQSNRLVKQEGKEEFVVPGLSPPKKGDVGHFSLIGPTSPQGSRPLWRPASEAESAG